MEVEVTSTVYALRLPNAFSLELHAEPGCGVHIRRSGY